MTTTSRPQYRVGAIFFIGTLLSGIAMTLIVLLPLTIRDEFYMRAIKRQKKEAEDELARMRAMVAPSVGTT